jgi:hypothetical protein
MISNIFEKNKVCSVSELADRWKCHPERVYGYLYVGVISAWRPQEPLGAMGLMIDVKSVIVAESIHGITHFMFGGMHR